jgi:hypothetical protein
LSELGDGDQALEILAVDVTAADAPGTAPTASGSSPSPRVPPRRRFGWIPEVAAVILAALAGLGAAGATLAVDGGHVPETFP